MAQLSELHSDMLTQIITKLKHPSDHLRASAVSSSWRAIAIHHRLTLLPVPGLMLSPSKPTNKKRKFVELSQQNPSSDILEFDYLMNYAEYTCCGSHLGWLVLKLEEENENNMKYTKMILINPFLKRRRDLPTLYGKVVYKVVLSSSPSLDTEKCVVLGLLDSQGVVLCNVGHGDDNWTFLSSLNGFTDALFYQERFYVVDDYGKVYACNLERKCFEEIIIQPPIVSKDVKFLYYLVEIEGNLCKILRKMRDYEYFYGVDDADDENYDDSKVYDSYCVSTREFRVWRMNPCKKKWELVRQLGEYALFLGCNNSIALNESGSDGRIKRNCVYFTDNRHKFKHFGIDRPGRDMGLYDMKDMSIKHLHSDNLYKDPFSYDPPAVWVAPLLW